MKSPDIRKVLVVVGLILAGAVWQITSLILDNRPITNYPPKGTHVVALGGSLTVGVGASDNEHGYVALLSKRLNIPIVNKGKSGDTTVGALTRLADVLNEKPNIVIIFLGGNDYLQKIHPQESLNNLHTIITTIQSHGAIVLLLGYTTAYDTYLEPLARKTGSYYVPSTLEGIIGNPLYMSSDNIHPNDAGYLKITDRVAPILLELVSAAPPQTIH